MKSKFLLLAALLVAMFTACSDDIDKDDPVITGDGEAWLSLRINPSVTTRALNGTPSQNGTGAESSVDAVRVVLFKTQNVTQVIDLTAAQRGTPGESNGASTGTAGEAFKVSPKPDAILVIVNPASNLPTFLPGTPFSAVNTAVTANVSTVTATTGFMMTNDRGDLEALTDANLKSTADVAEQNALTLNVDRVAAKVRLFAPASFGTPPVTPPTQDDQIVMLATDIEWDLNVTNKKYFPVSKRIKTTVGTTVWSDRYNLGSYRIDPNYGDDPAGSPAQAIWGTADYGTNYNYSVDDADANWSATTTSDADEVKYCLENTQDVAYNTHAYTTHVLVRANVRPSHYKELDGTYTASTANDSWFKVGTGYYTYNILLDWIESELTSYYSGSQPIPSLANALNAYFAAIPVSEIDIDSYTGGTFAERAARAKADFAAKNGDLVAKRVGSLSYYDGSINYYKVMIKHDDDKGGNTVNGLGEFGVVRNSVYDVNVTGVMNAGYPIIPEPNPDEDDEENDLYLSVEININPWTWYTQDVIL